MYDPKAVLDEFAKVCVQLKIEYDLFRSLFDRGPQQTALLQQTAPYLFGDLYGIVRNHLFLGFCRITDAAGRGNSINLTTNFVVKTHD